MLTGISEIKPTVQPKGSSQKTTNWSVVGALYTFICYVEHDLLRRSCILVWSNVAVYPQKELNLEAGEPWKPETSLESCLVARAPEAQHVCWHWITVRFDTEKNSTHLFDFCSICDTETWLLNRLSQGSYCIALLSFFRFFQHQLNTLFDTYRVTVLFLSFSIWTIMMGSHHCSVKWGAAV